MSTTPTETTKTTGDTTTTKATTTQTTPASGTACTANSDGTCGNAKPIESYLFVDFENDAFTTQQVSLDPALCHLDHIGQDAYVGVGNGISSFDSNGKAQSIVVRVDRCSKMSQYADKTSVELGPPSGTPNCKKDYTWVWKAPSSKKSMLGFVATSPDGTYVIVAGVKEKNNNVHARQGL